MVRAELPVHRNWAVAQRWIIRVIIASVASWYAWQVVVHSGERPMFAPSLPLVSDLQYPTASVVLTIASMVVEVLLVDLLLNYRARAELWRRALVGGVAMLPVSVFSRTALLEAPPYHGIHLLWLVSLNVILVGLAAVSGFAHLMRVVSRPPPRG
jgi:hypothetical protein